jgi:hypothetical protein
MCLADFHLRPTTTEFPPKRDRKIAAQSKAAVLAAFRTAIALLLRSSVRFRPAPL